MILDHRELETARAIVVLQKPAYRLRLCSSGITRCRVSSSRRPMWRPSTSRYSARSTTDSSSVFSATNESPMWLMSIGLRSVRRIFGGALDAACSKRYAGKNPPRSVSRFLPEQRTQRPSRSTPEPDTDWFKKRRWPASTSSTSNTPHEHNPGRAQSRNREPWTRLVPDWYSSKARCSENSGWLTLQLGLAHPPTRPGRGSIPSKVPELEGERRGVGG